MIPFILTIVGGYLIGDSMKESGSDALKFSDGGDLSKRYEEIESQRMNTRLKIATIIGVDKALRYLEKDYSVSPFSLIQSAVTKGFITIDEINQDVWDAAVSEAEDIDETYKDSGQGISSSDINAFIYHMLNNAGIKIVVVDNRYERADKLADGGQTDYLTTGEVKNYTVTGTYYWYYSFDKSKKGYAEYDEVGFSKDVKAASPYDAEDEATKEIMQENEGHILGADIYIEDVVEEGTYRNPWMADGGDIDDKVALWKTGGGKAEKIKEGSRSSIKGFLTRNRFKGMNWESHQRDYKLSIWPADATEEEVLNYRDYRNATSQEYADGGKTQRGKYRSRKYWFSIQPKDKSKESITMFGTMEAAEEEAKKHNATVEKAIKMADGGQTDFMKLYNLASEKQRLRNSLHNASPERQKEILKKIAEVDSKMDQVSKSMGYAEGGSIADSNNQMLRSKVKEVKHHADELGRVVKPKTEVEAWVVAKAERSASDLSDITHYLDGKHK